jgi:hypothetical protein
MKPKPDTKICDSCKERVSLQICEICDKDTCPECLRHLAFKIVSKTVFMIRVCNHCKEKIDKTFIYGKPDEKKELTERFGEIIKPKIVAFYRNELFAESL